MLTKKDDTKVTDKATEVVVTGKEVEPKSKEEIKAEKSQQKLAEETKHELDKVNHEFQKKHEKKLEEQQKEHQKKVKEGKAIDVNAVNLTELRKALKDDEAKEFTMTPEGRAKLEGKTKPQGSKKEKWEYWTKIRPLLGQPDADPTDRAMVRVNLKEVVIINGEKFGPGEDVMVPASAYSTWASAHVEPEPVEE